jgi:hypothetical protein
MGPTSLAPEQVARALTHFVDAEHDPMPAGCTVGWQKVKAELGLGVQRWDKGRRE